jgi:hypothetical protein
MKSRLLWFCVVVFAFCLPVVLVAQDTASITGTVTDPTGAAIPGAQVTVTSLEHGINRAAASNSTGDYLFAALPIGSYNLTVAAPGFKKYAVKGVILTVAQKARVDVAMQVGGTNTEVTVEGTNVAQVETQSSDLGGTVTGKEITQLQLNGRNFTQLITLVPGVTNQSGQDEAQVGVNGNVAYTVNGGRTEYNNWEMDGGDALDNGSNTSLNVYPSIDAIAEFKVLSSNYGAQYGRNGSGTVEVETKSGTSSFHGDLYEFVRNDMFNATPFFQTTVPPYKKNDFGYTLGGPIFIPGHYNTDKQKTFFFWSQEWRRDRVPSGFSVTTVPSVAERGGNFNDLCPAAGTTYSAASATQFPDCPVQGLASGSPTYFPNNQVPLAPGPTVAALEGLIPEPNVGVNSWLQTPTLPTNWREELFRIDHNFTDKVRGSFRYIHDSWAQIYPTPLWTSGTSFPTVETNFIGPGVSMVAHLTATASPTLLNEFVASYTTDHITTGLIGAWQRPAGMNVGIFQNGFGGKVPGISLNGGIYNGINEDPGYVPNGPLNSNPTYTYKDNVTKIIGSHNLQFGAYFVAAQKNEIPQPSFGINGNLTFDTSNTAVTSGNAFADLLLGNVSVFQQEKSAVKTYNRYKIFEPYFQDDWHATKRLTLNLGLRVSLFGTYREIHHNAWNFDPSHYVVGASSTNSSDLVVGNPYNGWVQCGVSAGVPAGCMKGHLFNPAPRIGFAFDPKGDGKWALRGGYGIFYEHTNQGEANAGTLEQYNPLTQTASLSNTIGYANINPSALGTTTTPLSFVSIPNKATWPYVQQWHLDIEHEIVRNTVATLSYVGSAGVHLTREFELNQLQPVPLAQNPYKPGEPMSSADCGPTTDAYGVPTNGTTPSGVPILYQVGANGLATGPAVNLGVAACGTIADPFRPYPGIGSITRKEESASSVYHAFEASVRHSVGGLQLNLAYTYSHSIDDSSDYSDVSLINAYDLNAFRASSNFDQRHVFNIGYVYDLPFFKNAGLTHKLLGGWEWSGITLIQSGTPFSVYNSGGNGVPGDNAGVANAVATSGASWPDVVGNPRSAVQQIAGLPFGPLLFNPAAFVAPRGLTFGDAGRNILTNPFRTNFDMALLKHFAITESKYFEFRAEGFNIFNHTEFSWLGGDAGSAANNQGLGTAGSSIGCYGGANNSAGDPSCTLPSGAGVAFLHATAVHNARILQLALKFIF